MDFQWLQLLLLLASCISIVLPIAVQNLPIRFPVLSRPAWANAAKVQQTINTRGLQCFKLNGNQTENDRYLEKNNCLLFAKFLKMYSFFRICILRLQKVLLWPKKFFSWQISIWVSKTRRILCWFQIHWCRLSEMPLTKVKSKKPRKNAHKTKKLEIRLVFWL